MHMWSSSLKLITYVYTALLLLISCSINDEVRSHQKMLVQHRGNCICALKRSFKIKDMKLIVWQGYNYGNELYRWLMLTILACHPPNNFVKLETLIFGKPPVEQERACAMVKTAPQEQ